MNGFNSDIIKIALERRMITIRNAVKLLNILKYGSLTCELCKCPIERKKKYKLSFDHIIPISKGGNGDFENLQIAHYICNARKGNKTINKGEVK